MVTVSQGSPETITLPVGYTLTVTANAVSSGNVYPFSERLGDTPGVSTVAAGATVTLGPFATVKRYQIDAVSGSLSYSTAADDFPTLSEASAAAAAAAAAADFAIVGTIGNLCEVIGAGAPAATAQAALTVNPTGDDNSLTFTAVAYGSDGNDISIEYVDPSANDAELSVDVVGSAITVNLATDSGGSITSTAAEVLAAIEASTPAAALVTVAIDASDTGSGDDGSGVVTVMALDNFEGGTGVAIGVAGKGSRYTDTTNGTLYLNTGTLAVPVWTQLAAA